MRRKKKGPKIVLFRADNFNFSIGTRGIQLTREGGYHKEIDDLNSDEIPPAIRKLIGGNDSMELQDLLPDEEVEDTFLYGTDGKRYDDIDDWLKEPDDNQQKTYRKTYFRFDDEEEHTK